MAKGAMVVTYDLPDNVDEGYAKLQHIADELRPHFQGKPDVKLHVVVREMADAVIAYLSDDEEKGAPDADDVNSGYRRGPND